MAYRYNSIPDPTNDPETLRITVLALKEIVEVLIRQRRPVELGAVTWQNLVDLELIAPDQVPSR